MRASAGNGKITMPVSGVQRQGLALTAPPGKIASPATKPHWLIAPATVLAAPPVRPRRTMPPCSDQTNASSDVGVARILPATITASLIAVPRVRVGGTGEQRRTDDDSGVVDTARCESGHRGGIRRDGSAPCHAMPRGAAGPEAGSHHESLSIDPVSEALDVPGHRVEHDGSLVRRPAEAYIGRGVQLRLAGDEGAGDPVGETGDDWSGSPEVAHAPISGIVDDRKPAAGSIVVGTSASA